MDNSLDRLIRRRHKGRSVELACLALVLMVGAMGCAGDTDTTNATEPEPASLENTEVDSIPSNARLAASSGDTELDAAMLEAVLELGELIPKNDDDGVSTSAGNDPTERFEVKGRHVDYGSVTLVAHLAEGRLEGVLVARDDNGSHTEAWANVSEDGTISPGFFDGSTIYEVATGAPPSQQTIHAVFGFGGDYFAAFSTQQKVDELKLAK